MSVNYDGFIDDVSAGDELLVDGGIISFKVVDKTDTDVMVSSGRVCHALAVKPFICLDYCGVTHCKMPSTSPEMALRQVWSSLSSRCIRSSWQLFLLTVLMLPNCLSRWRLWMKV